jgi:hypothetical protein
VSKPTETDLLGRLIDSLHFVEADIPAWEASMENKLTMLQIIAAARAEGWQAANHAWQDWLEANIPDWDAMAGVDLTTLPKEMR